MGDVSSAETATTLFSDVETKKEREHKQVSRTVPKVRMEAAF